MRTHTQRGVCVPYRKAKLTQDIVLMCLLNRELAQLSNNTMNVIICGSSSNIELLTARQTLDSAQTHSGSNCLFIWYSEPRSYTLYCHVVIEMATLCITCSFHDHLDTLSALMYPVSFSHIMITVKTRQYHR